MELNRIESQHELGHIVLEYPNELSGHFDPIMAQFDIATAVHEMLSDKPDYVELIKAMESRGQKSDKAMLYIPGVDRPAPWRFPMSGKTVFVQDWISQQSDKYGTLMVYGLNDTGERLYSAHSLIITSRGAIFPNENDFLDNYEIPSLVKKIRYAQNQ
jgi:hypothetical protein